MGERVLKGIPAAEGIAVGPAFRFQALQLDVPERSPEAPEAEMARFEAAREQAREEIAALKAKLQARADDDSAAIFDAHAMMLADPMLHDAVRRRVEAGATVEAAVAAATEELAAMLGGMDDALFAARAVDVQDVGRRVLRILLGLPDASLDAIGEPSIVVAHDLTPSDTVSMQPEMTLGFCTAAGGLTSHTAILARTLGIPAVVGLGQAALEEIESGVTLALDGSTGQVVVAPAADTLERFEATRDQQATRLSEIRARAAEEAHTADGRRVEVGANVGDLTSAQEAVRFGAEGVGLLRTEFLYLQEKRPPDEEKQIAAYRAIFEALAGRPVIVRTLDIGGDKPPPYLTFPDELNPFLGWRAIRIGLDDLPLFKTQLRAILRAAVGHHTLIMFPMVSGVGELRRARAVVEEVRSELDAQGLAYADDVPVGIMVETPAAAMLADALAAECDFFSLGTNDLTQYTLAVDRTNERVAGLFQPLHPAVLRLIQRTIEAAHAQGKWVGMCGELAGMKRAIPILLGLGLDEFSMAPRAIPEAKWVMGQLTDAQMAAIAQQALDLTTADEVEDFARQTLSELGT